VPPPIIPAFHGTSLVLSEKIFEAGFANLSSLDSGFFGKGIYFTSSSKYTIPYMSSRTRPCVIMSWLLPGNPFPVTEDPEGPASLLGTALQSGYNSHYVVTNLLGKIATKRDKELYDEIVIAQESQICPALLFEISDRTKKSISSRFLEETKRIEREKGPAGCGESTLARDFAAKF